MPIDIPENEEVNFGGLFLSPVEFTEAIPDEVIPNHTVSDEPKSKKGIPNPFSKIKTDPESPKASERPFGTTPAMPKAGLITEKVASLYVMIGMGVMMKDEHCGTAIMNSAEDAAKSIEALAKANPKVRKYVLMMLETGAWSGVLMAHAPIMMAVYAHHKPGVKNIPESDSAPVHDIRTAKAKQFTAPPFNRPGTNN